VADLRLLIAVEKSWLVTRTLTPAFAEESQYDRFAEQLARLFGRKASARSVDDIARAVDQLLREITIMGPDPIEEVGLDLGRSRLDPTNAQVVFMLNGELADDFRERIVDWWEPVAAASRAGGIDVLPPRFVQLDQMSASEYRSLDILDAGRFSPDAHDLDADQRQ